MTDKFTAWRQHFENQARGLIPRENTFYQVSSTPQRQQEELFGKQIEMAPSTQQAVARAKNALDNINIIYDPVLGIQRHFRGRTQRVKKSFKTSSKKTKSNSKKKSKKGKSKSKK